MNKKWYQSIKFFCFIISLILFTGMSLYAINQDAEMIGMVSIIVTGFISVSYIFGQSYVDKYVNLTMGRIKQSKKDETD